MLRRLFAALLCRPGEWVSTAELIGALWGEGSPVSAPAPHRAHANLDRFPDGQLNDSPQRTIPGLVAVGRAGNRLTSLGISR